MDILTFIVEVLKVVAWPSMVILFLLTFRGPIDSMLSAIKKVTYKDFAIEFEEVTVTQDPQIDQLMSVLQNSAHSFDWIRGNSQFKFTDEEFDRIITKHSKYFARTRIVKRDENGNRVKPGLPGMKLTNEALKEIQAEKE